MYSSGMPHVLHPYIESDQSICGGSPRVAGTHITVRTIATYVLQYGLSPDELLTYYPHVGLAAIYDALSYYYDHRTEIDAEIASQKDCASPPTTAR